MRRRKALSVLLSLALLLSLVLPAATVRADDSTGDGGMQISKTATANADGTYTITLEAFATGSKVISDVTKDIPTDIVLVIDQSGSMADDIGSVSFNAYTGKNARNGNLYSNRHNGGNSNLWHLLNDGSYVSVSVTRSNDPDYTQINNGKNNSTSGGATSYRSNQNNLYALVNGVYQKVTVRRDYSITDWDWTYTYTLPDGTQIASSQGDNASPTFAGIDGGVLYLLSAITTYTYFYTDGNGNVQTIGTSTGDNTTFSTTLYRRSTSTTGGGTRLAAIKSAAATFVDAVAAKAAGTDGQLGTADDINHRIAVVGFASQSGYGNNTELLSISGRNSGNVGVAYNNITAQDYKDVVQDMDTSDGKAMVDSAIDALAANGATRIDLGMNMAKNILDANPVPAGEQRNRVVIVFTDGSPTDSNGFEKSVANSAINTSGTIKTSGAKVYSIGVFSGADAGSAGVEPSGDLSQNSGQLTAACNWFMQKVSSNNGTPQRPSYYLSASDMDSLNNIFQQISDQIETGGSSSTLTSEAVVKDLISPQFELPEGTTANDITLETYACTGRNADGEYTWSNNNRTMGAVASVRDGQVSVTGFNFSENYVGTVTENGNTTYRGNKLVIRFRVRTKDGFLGGNDVYTNTNAGIYENAEAETPVRQFERPTVNVPISDVAVEAQDKNVYLLGSVTADALKNGARVKVGDVELKLNEANYGLADWQTEYVDITVVIRDKDNNVITDGLENLTEDTAYTITVTVSPKTTGQSTPEKGEAAVAKSGSNDPAAKINVFKPQLTFGDGTAYYGETAPADKNYSANRIGADRWMHGDTASEDVSMLGEKPTLAIRYAPDESKLSDGKYTKQDVPVSVSVGIGSTDVTNHVTFIHEPCNPGCAWTQPAEPGKPAFLIHIRTCELTVSKRGGAENEPYVFDVYKDGEKYSEVTVVGNTSETLAELPVGTYTIRENESWSWRYQADNGEDVSLTRQNPTGNITCTNTQKNDQWLNGFSQVVRNIFGVQH